VQPDPDSQVALASSDADAQFAAAVTAVTSAFGDPTRREIYLFVRSNPGATATEVASRFSLHPNVARHHLERLAAGGYVEITMERADGGGAGRPSKRFRAIGAGSGKLSLKYWRQWEGDASIVKRFVVTVQARE